ncbi:hypothetical protein [Amorphus sp. 3PC139-8]|uniref:hypothetical protein n=1 Tax=Amorphus sp. 3PC139-8 TaxID=2735676 RepID=UPI00345CD597
MDHPSSERDTEADHLDRELELEARANLATALWTNLRSDVAVKDREILHLQRRCEALEGELAAERARLQAEYARLWNSRSRLLKRGFRLMFGLERREG